MKKIAASIAKYIKDTDKWLILFCVIASSYQALILSGLYSSSLITDERKIIVQVGAVAAGLVAAIIISKFDYHVLQKLWKLHVPLSYALVLLTFFIGAQRGDADDRAWINLPFGMSIQPAELLKISFILTFSLHLSKLSREELNKPKNLLLVCLHGGLPVLLIHFQGDDGTAMIIGFIFLSMLFAAGVSFKYISAAVATLLVALPVAWFSGIISDDQKNRIRLIYDPNYVDVSDFGYQQYNGSISIGSGGVAGNGIFTGQHRYVPEIQNDFIFSFIGEALGFIGCIAVLVILMTICSRILFVSALSKDASGRYICVGVFATILFQTIVNIGMNLRVLPVIGVTLPFFSAGGTSIATLYLGIGLVLSVYVHNKSTLFLDK